MKIFVVTAVFALCWLPFFQPAIADTLEIPLPVLPGVEPGESWDVQRFPIAADLIPADVRKVKLRLTGQGGMVWWVNCDGAPPNGVLLPGELKVKLSRIPDGEDYAVTLDSFLHSFTSYPWTTFDLEWTFDLTDPGALAGGAGMVVFEDPTSPHHVGGHYVCPGSASCVIETGVLIFEYGDLVPVESHAWGSLKALYR